MLGPWATTATYIQGSRLCSCAWTVSPQLQLSGTETYGPSFESLLRHWRPTVLLLKRSFFISADTFISRMIEVFTSRLLSLTSSTGLRLQDLSLLSSSGVQQGFHGDLLGLPRGDMALGHVDADAGVGKPHSTPGAIQLAHDVCLHGLGLAPTRALAKQVQVMARPGQLPVV